MAYGIQDPIDLAKCIAGMSYQGLLAVAHELVNMNSPDALSDRDASTPHGMADTLADWAQVQVEEAEEAAAKVKVKAA